MTANNNQSAAPLDVTADTTSSTEVKRNELQRDEREQDLQHIREALRGLRYGTVSIIIQDGVVVQIDRTEKKRVRRGGA